MNVVMLNNASLDGDVVIKRGGGSGGGVQINNQEKNVDIVANGTTDVTPDAGFTGLSKVSVNVNVPSNGGSTGWTGHADAEGLRAIGWTDEDIAYYQAHGVNWNAEDDEYHKVSDDNKALYGVLTANNIFSYKDRIVYLPKIDFSGVNMDSKFQQCYAMVAIPYIDTRSSIYMSSMFSNCWSLVSVPPIDMENATSASYMFSNCYSLRSVSLLNSSKTKNVNYLFTNCYSLVYIGKLDTRSAINTDQMFSGCKSLVSIPQLDVSNVTDMGSMFSGCNSLVSIPQLDVKSNVYISNVFTNCYSLINANLKNVNKGYQLSNSPLLSKKSLLYIINNEAAESAITIKLASYAYERLANDVDIVEALANHPNISLAK